MSEPLAKKLWFKLILAAILLYVIIAQIQFGHPWIAGVFSVSLAILVILEILVRRSS